jgi:hypothetical protein
MADHFDGAITELGFTVGVTRKNGPCGGLGIHGVGLTMPATELPVNPADLDDTQAHRSQRACETGTVGASPFNAERVQGPVLACPGCHLPIALACYRERCGGKPGAQSVDSDGDVDVFMSIDADDDGVWCDIMHTGPPGGWNPKALHERTGL